MLYIFHVNTGSMLNVDMNLALEDANTLRAAIKKITGIAVEKQILLASGGEGLEPKVRVCSYFAGTDTNPIYLFSKELSDFPPEQTSSSDYVPATNFKEEVEASVKMPPTIQTVNLRCQLAQQICELSRQVCRCSERLVHEQHLQQQGWAAVIANLEDLTSDFAQRIDAFEGCYVQYLETRSQCLEMLEIFSNDVGLLSQIPVLPALIPKDHELFKEVKRPSEETEDDSLKEASSTEGEAKFLSLLEWISVQDEEFKVEEMVDECRKTLEKFDESFLVELRSELNSILEAASKVELREIKGLEDRLYGLDQLKIESGKVYQEQTELAQAFLHNQSRANNLGDTSILPDLCASHKRQLLVMQKNLIHLKDINRRCLMAKKELVDNLGRRLQWVMLTEHRIDDVSMKLLLRNQYVRDLQSKLTVLQQLHMAPTAYLTAVSEVVRRRTFSQAFLVWASDLAIQLCGIYTEEVARRRNFQSQFEGHFLSSLFPGLEDMPPAFATQPPESFDELLPRLTMEDVELLRSQLPHLMLLLSVPDTSSVTQFFLNRSSTNLKPEPPNPTASIEDRIVEAVTAAGLSSNLDPALLQPATECSQSMLQSATTTQPISSDRGFESETDTEEFEKVGQSPSDIHFDKPQDISVHHDKEEKGKKCVADELRSRLDKMGSTVGEAVADLRSDVGDLKQWILCEQTELEGLISQVQEAWSRHYDVLRKEIEEKEKTLELLNQSRDSLMEELNTLREEKKIRDAVHGKELSASGSAETERKPRNTTRSASESHLGFVEGFNFDLKDHDEIVSRLREQVALERFRAMKEEQLRCEARFNQELTQALIKADADKQALFNASFRRLCDKKFETLRSLSQDFDFKADIFSDLLFSDSNVESTYTFPEANEEKTIKSELSKAIASSSPKSGHKDSPSSSIVTVDNNQLILRDAATSPEPSPRKSRIEDRKKEKLSESTNSLIQQGKISVGSCNEGDIVLVMWDDKYGTYTILQESSSHTYFLHLDSLSPLGLRVEPRKSESREPENPDNPNNSEIATPRKTYVIGEVANKEYCQAKRSENRYNVPMGHRFYRVRVKPLKMKPGH